MSIFLSIPWWITLFFVIGVVALVAVILALFSKLGDRPGSVSVTEICPVDSCEFLVSLAGTLNAPLQQGGTARLLNNGDEFLPAMLDAMRQARCSINFTTYIWEPGRVSDLMFDMLTEKAREGVAVRVIIDAFGGRKASDERIEELKRAGGKWARFHPLRFGKLTRLHRRNHRRAIVIDGRIGYTGGAAVMDKWLGNAQDPEHWRDCMVEVRGGIATNLQSAFTQLWSGSTGEMLTGSAFYPLDHEEEANRESGEPISRHINVISSPSAEAHPLRRLFWLSFRSARKTIYITNPYFVPDEIMQEVLQERARAGVDVRVLVPNEHNDIPLIRWASHSFYEELLETGIRIFEYQPTMIHQKHAVVDGTWSIIGSANMDVRSKELNQENVLGIQDRGFARQMEDAFFADLARAREIELDEWRRRPLWRRLPERFFRLFEEQF